MSFFDAIESALTNIIIKTPDSTVIVNTEDFGAPCSSYDDDDEPMFGDDDW